MSLIQKLRTNVTLDRREFMDLMQRLYLQPAQVLGENLWELANPYNDDMVDRQFYFEDISMRLGESPIKDKHRMVISGVMLEQGERGKPIKYKFRYSEQLQL
nr:hypothetical protein [Nanoarchaeum sp.]